MLGVLHNIRGKILSANRKSRFLLLGTLFMYHKGALMAADVPLWSSFLRPPLVQFSSTLKLCLIEMVGRGA